MTKKETPKTEECHDPVCEDSHSNLFKAFKRTRSTTRRSRRLPCPLNKAQYGRSTWEFLHTTAAYYPENPTEAQKESAKQLIDSIKVLYACSSCREHYKDALDEKEVVIDYSSNMKLQKSVCNLHNHVNEVLGKTIFECTEENLIRRWRKGEERCQKGESVYTRIK